MKLKEFHIQTDKVEMFQSNDYLILSKRNYSDFIGVVEYVAWVRTELRL